MQITITIEQATVLFSILSRVPLKNDENSVRWMFLDSLEPEIAGFEKTQDELFAELRIHEFESKKVDGDKLSFIRAEKAFKESIDALKKQTITCSINPGLLKIYNAIETEKLSVTESRIYAQLHPIFNTDCI